MEPLSAVASFFAIADILQKLYRKLRSYAKSLRQASTEARALAKELSGFSSMLLMADRTLSRLHNVMQTDPRLRKVQRIQCAAAKAVAKELGVLVGKFDKLLSADQPNFFRSLRMRHRWTAVKEHTHRLQFSIESSKSSLNLFLTLVHLEQCIEMLRELQSDRKADQRQHSKQIKSLKATIKTYGKQVRTERRQTARLQERYERLATEQGIKPEDCPDTTKAVQQVIDLAQDELKSAREHCSATSSSSQAYSSSRPSSAVTPGRRVHRDGTGTDPWQSSDVLYQWSTDSDTTSSTSSPSTSAAEYSASATESIAEGRVTKDFHIRIKDEEGRTTWSTTPREADDRNS